MKRAHKEVADDDDTSFVGSTEGNCLEEVHGSDGSIHEHSDNDNFQQLDEKVEKNRERNREHAKRTRLRKKEMMESMKMRLLELQRESARLEQLLEESSTANILLCLSVKQDGSNSVPSSSGAVRSSNSANEDKAGSASSNDDFDEKMVATKGNIIDQLRQKVRVEAASSLKDSKEDDTEDEYCDMKEQNVSTWQNGQSVIGAGTESHGSPSANEDSKMFADPDTVKRERNRMHAKLTRDRKKLFTSRMQQTIQTLERHNQLLRNRVNNLIFAGIGRSASGNHLVAMKPEEATHFPPPLNSLPLGYPVPHSVAMGQQNLPALSTAYTRAPSAAIPQAYTKFGLMSPNGWMGPMFPRTWPFDFTNMPPNATNSFHPIPISSSNESNSENQHYSNSNTGTTRNASN